MEGAKRAYLQRLNPVLHVIDRTGRRGEMQDVVHGAQVVRLVHVLPGELKARLVLQVRDVTQAAGQQVVDTDHLMAFRQKRIAKVRADKAIRWSVRSEEQ